MLASPSCSFGTTRKPCVTALGARHCQMSTLPLPLGASEPVASNRTRSPARLGAQGATRTQPAVSAPQQACNRMGFPWPQRCRYRNRPFVVPVSTTSSVKSEHTMATGTIQLHRVLRATPERIYRAFLEPDALAKWL